jgi:hypothetical protein
MSETFTGDLEFSSSMRDTMLECFDDSLDNFLGTDMMDLELAYAYFGDPDTLYGDYKRNDVNFEVFPQHSGSHALSERNHIDIYFARFGTDTRIGSYPSNFEDSDEDPGERYHYNSFQSTDGGVTGGPNAKGIWLERLTYPWDHEFQHLLRASSATYMQPWANEMFSEGAVYLAGIKESWHRWQDFPYDVSPVYLDEWTHGPNPDGYGETRYRTLRMLVGYLLYHYKGTDTSGDDQYLDDLLYTWRGYDGPGQYFYHGSMYALARVLDDSAYTALGGSGENPGEERLIELWRLYSLAKWIDDDSIDSDYRYDPATTGRIRPWKTMGLFTRNAESAACSSFCVPPEFVVGASLDCGDSAVSGLWKYPEESSDCQRRIEVWTYGSDYISFLADTLQFDADDKSLFVTVDWDTFPQGDTVLMRI